MTSTKKATAAKTSTAKSLDAAADKANPKPSKDGSDNTIKSFEDLKAALEAKGIKTEKIERTYHLTLTKGSGKQTLQHTCKITENATDKELASVYSKAVEALGA